MGVNGLWSVINSAGQDVEFSSLKGAVVAIDISVWLNMALKGMRNKSDLSPLPNGHLLYLFRRICFLLELGMKPIFVFDGQVPHLKRKAQLERKLQRSKNENKYESSKRLLLLYKALKGDNLESFKQLNLIKNLTKLEEEKSVDERKLKKLKSFMPSPLTDNVILPDDEKFKDLPKNEKYKIISELRKQLTYESIPILEGMRPIEYSENQFKRLLKKCNLTRMMNDIENEMKLETLETLENEFPPFRNNKPSSNLHKTILTGNKLASNSHVYQLLLQKEGIIESNSPNNDVDLKNCVQNQVDDVNFRSNLSPTKSQMKTLKFRLSNRKRKQDEGFKKAYNKVKKDKLHVNWKEGKKSDDEIIDLDESFSLPTFFLDDETNINFSKNEDKEVEDMESNYDGGNVTFSSYSSYHDYIHSIEPNLSNLMDVNSLENSKIDDLEPVIAEYYNKDGEKPRIKMENNTLCENIFQPTEGSLFQEDKNLINEPNCEFMKNHTKTVSMDNQMENNKYAPLINENDCSCLSQKSGIIIEEINTQIFEDTKNDAESVLMEINKGTCIITENDSSRLSQKSGIINKEINTKIFEDTQNDIESVLMEINKDTCIINENDSSCLFKKSAIINKEIETRLFHDMKKFERKSLTLSEYIQNDVFSLLCGFGIPYIVAPGEAEAQCASLNSSGVCDFVLTNDGDALLFGSKMVLKGFLDSTSKPRFSKKNFSSGRLFDISHIEKELYLKRNDLIAFAMLSGCDYTPGLDGVGPIHSLEIISEFTSDDPINTLNLFKDFFCKQKTLENSKNKTWKNLLKSVNLPETFPSKAIADAFLVPTVDNFKKSDFKWDEINIPQLKSLCIGKLGWNDSKVDQMLFPLKKIKNTQKISLITCWFPPVKSTSVQDLVSSTSQPTRKPSKLVKLLEKRRNLKNKPEN